VSTFCNIYRNICTTFNSFVYLFQKSSFRRRYLAVSVGNTNVSHSEGQAVCEEVGAGLATVFTDADYVALNTTVHQSGAPYHCNKERMLMGAESSGNFNWKWQTGHPLSTHWTYWVPGEPNRSDTACMRATVSPDIPVAFVDNVCENKVLNCILCDA